MQSKYIITCDVGTTSAKTVLISDEGKVINDCKTEYPLIQPNPGWAEQDPEVLWSCICQTIKEIVEKTMVSPSSIRAIVFAAPWKNIIPVDKNGNVLYNSLIWMDARGIDQAKRLNEKVGSFVGTGQEYWPRLMWLKENEPEVWNNAEHIMGLNTFFKWKATGEIATEPSDDFIHSYNKDLQEYYTNIIKCAGLEEDLDKFPELKISTEKVGEITEKAAEEMGLVQGIPVFGGFGDLPAITIGTGCCQTDMAHIYMGTSSWFVTMLDERKGDFAPQYFTFDPTHEGALFALQTGCLAFDWTIEQLYHAERKILGGEVFDYVNKDIKDIPAGSDNLIATHWLNGELPPLAKNAKALFFNLTTNHDRRYMVKSMMESICYTHKRYIQKYEKETGKKLDSIRVVGGGAVSDLWMQILADVLDMTVEIPQSPRYTGAMGAYYCAKIGLGDLENYNSVYDAVEIEKTFKPNEQNREIYDKLYNVYIKLYPALKDLYNEINGEY